MKVSIIIPTYNRQGLVKNCLESLFNQKISKKIYEIIVIDDGSIDQTQDLIKNLKKKYKNLKYFKQKHSGPAAARNLGIKRSKGEIIAFIDDDCIAKKNWVENIIKAHKKYFLYAGIGGETYNILKNNRIANIRQFIWEYSIQTQNACNPILKRLKHYVCPFSLGKTFETFMLPSNNVSYKRNIFNKYLFDTSFNTASGEDSELNWRLKLNGFKLLYNPSIKIYHNHVSSLKIFLIQTFNHGKNVYKIKLKHNNFYPIFFDNFFQTGLFISAFLLMPLLKSLQIRNIKDYLIYIPYLFLYEFVYRLGIISGVMFYGKKQKII